MTHHTTDPERRAQHIANREQQNHELDLIRRGENHLRDWPEYWQATYRRVLYELTWTPFVETTQ
jgi:hypothetical protein